MLEKFELPECCKWSVWRDSPQNPADLSEWLCRSWKNPWGAYHPEEYPRLCYTLDTKKIQRKYLIISELFFHNTQGVT